MYIYLIEIKEYAGYDTFRGHVVIAHSSKEARSLCPFADEGDIWNDINLTTSKQIGETHLSKPQVVLSSFSAG